MVAHAGDGDEALGHGAAELGLSAEQMPVLDASFAVLMDEEGTVWFGREATEQAQIASLTKIMTALVAVEYLDAGSSIVVTPEAAAVGESSAGLASGDAMTFDTALKALLTASGNDAAFAIAEAAGARMLGEAGDAYACEAAFVDAMNVKATEWGLVNSRFTNPHGLDFDAYAQGQYSCAQDVAALLRRAMGNELIRANIGYAQVDIIVSRGGADTTLSLINTDTMLQGYAGTCAAKTGYTLAAGPCVATAVNRGDGHEYYAVVLGSSSKPQRFADSEALYDWVYAQRDTLQAARAALSEGVDKPAVPVEPAKEQVSYQLVAAARFATADIGNGEAAYPVVAEVALADWMDRIVEATVADPGKTVTVPKEAGRIEQEASIAAVTGDVHRGDVVGRLTFQQEGAVLWETDLIALEDAPAPTWWEAAGVSIQRFFGGLFGAPATAESALLNPGAMSVS